MLTSYLLFLCCSLAKSHLILCDSMDSSLPGFTVLYYLLNFAQTHVHQVSDAIQPFPPLSTLSSPALNLSQHHGLFQWVSSLHLVAKVLKLQLQHQSFQWIFRIDWFNLLALQGTLKSLLQHHNSKESVLWHSAFFMVELSYTHDYWKNHSFDYMDLCQQTDVSAF